MSKYWSDYMLDLRTSRADKLIQIVKILQLQICGVCHFANNLESVIYNVWNFERFVIWLNHKFRYNSFRCPTCFLKMSILDGHIFTRWIFFQHIFIYTHCQANLTYITFSHHLIITSSGTLVKFSITCSYIDQMIQKKILRNILVSVVLTSILEKLS